MLTPSNIREIERNFRSKVTKTRMCGQGYYVTLEDKRLYWVFADEDDAKKEAWAKLEHEMHKYPEVYEDHLKGYLYMPGYLKTQYVEEEAESAVEGLTREEILNMMDAENPLDLRAKLHDLKKDLSETDNPEVEKQIYETLKQTKKSLEQAGDFDKLKEGLVEILSHEKYKELSDPYHYFVEEHGTYDNLEKLMKSGLVKVNWSDAVEEFLDLDNNYGVHLSPYDGNEVYLDGMYAYRQE